MSTRKSRAVRHLVLIALVFAMAWPGGRVRAQGDAVPPCSADPAFAQLDFWLGTWDVFVQEQRVGENRIEKALNGCAVTEDWTDRTTLTPVGADEVRQVIEVSTDGGRSWQTTFDGRYARRR